MFTPDNPKNIRILERIDTPYNDILVLQNGTMRDIWFVRANEFFLQSRMDVNSPDDLALVYSKLMMSGLLFCPRPRNILVVGLGGGTVSGFLHQVFPQARIDVVEIDSKVVEVARKYFTFRESANYKVHVQDGRLFLREVGQEARYDLVFLDAFKSGSIPYHLKTLEYYQEIRRALAPGGVVVSNLYGKSNKLKPRDRATFSKVFGELYFFEDPQEVATALAAVDHSPRWNRDAMIKSADGFMANKGFPLDMYAVADYWRPERYEEKQANAFQDNFTENELPTAIAENNKNNTRQRPYPIKSFS